MTAFLAEALASAGLDADDARRLVGLHPVVAPVLPRIAERICAGMMDELPIRPEPLVRVRRTLIEWMSTGLLGPHDTVFDARRSRLASRHAELGLPRAFMLTVVAAVRAAYRERIIAAYDAAEATRVSAAVDKLLDVELALMLRHSVLVLGTTRVDALQTLCAGLAHEVRNPLNSARLQLELLERRLRRGGDGKLVEPIELAHHEIDRLTQLLDEFLAFARPPALDAREHDVVALVRDVVDLAQPVADRRGAQLALVGDGTPIVAEVDPVKLRQVVDNLVVNAIEAVTSGGHVAVAVVPIDGHVHIRVMDDGSGIPADILPRIYEPFFSTKDGTGMGMSIAHSLIAQHHGTIEVASSSGGTTFDVAVPRKLE